MQTEPDWTWQAHAACRGMDPESFFPGEEDVAPVVAVCESCPVRFSCLSSALERGERYGIWGGLTTKQRNKLDRAGIESISRRVGEEEEAGAHSAA